MAKKVVILGAGISGLATAFWLNKENIDVTLIEKNSEAGGAMISRKENGYLIDYGPNSGLETSPLIKQIVDEVGLSDEMIYANEEGNKRYILRNGILYALPTSPPAFFKTKLFSTKAKLRLFAEPFIGKSNDGYYQSISEFVRRRLGQEFLDYAINPFVAGVYHGRVRAMFDERNNKVEKAPPSAPVLVLGFEGVPQAGDTFVVVDSERTAREVAIKRQQLKREQDQRQVKHITLDEIAKQISIGGVKELPLIVKGDVDGSVEALSDSLMKISNEEVIIRVIHKGVGAISEGDVLLAAASGAIIIGFHVRPNLNARKLAESENVDIRLYNIIYDAINEVKSALEGLLSPVLSEEIVATVEVRETFKVPKVGTVAGCYVQEGKIQRTNKIRIIRQGIVVFEGELDSLKRFKDDVKEVDAGYECGLNVRNFNDIKISDIIEAYKIVETKKKLE